MIVSINQPAYLPWLGYFHRIAASDVHVVLDHVQFEKNSFTNRNKVRTVDGWCWLTVPVRTAGKFGSLPINALEIDQAKPWGRKHWSTLRLNYARALYFENHASFFERVYLHPWTKLNDLMTEVTTYLLDAFGIRTKIYYSSQMAIAGKKDELVSNLCRELGATQYLSGPLGRNYLRKEGFHSHGVTVCYDDYPHPTYPQAYSGFEPYMAAIDLLFNVGPGSLDVITKAQEQVAR